MKTQTLNYQQRLEEEETLKSAVGSITKRAVIEWLDTLGEETVVGVPQNPERCMFANYIRSAGYAEKVHVHPTLILADGVYCVAPEWMARAVRNFDKLLYEGTPIRRTATVAEGRKCLIA